MIKHVVLYKFKDTISQETINDIIEKFNNCKSLEGIIDIQFGDNFKQVVNSYLFL